MYVRVCVHTCMYVEKCECVQVDLGACVYV